MLGVSRYAEIVMGTRAIAKNSIKRAMQKVKELTPRGTHEKLEDTIKRINRWYMGWSSYYGMTQYPSQLKAIEAHIRRRLRSRIVSQQKSRRNLFHKLMKRGVARNRAAKASFNNKKRWAISHTLAVERAYPNKWFISGMGMKIRSNEGREDWFDIKQWVRLIWWAGYVTRTSGSVGSRGHYAPLTRSRKMLGKKAIFAFFPCFLATFILKQLILRWTMRRSRSKFLCDEKWWIYSCKKFLFRIAVIRKYEINLWLLCCQFFEEGNGRTKGLVLSKVQ